MPHALASIAEATFERIGSSGATDDTFPLTAHADLSRRE